MIGKWLEQLLRWGLADPRSAGLIMLVVTIAILILVLLHEKKGIGDLIAGIGPDKMAKMAAETLREQQTAITASEKKVEGLHAQLRQEKGNLGMLRADNRRFRRAVSRLGLNEASSQEG